MAGPIYLAVAMTLSSSSTKSAQHETDQAAVIALKRSEFGVRPGQTYPSNMMQTIPLIFLFPLGRADVRYTVISSGEGGENNNAILIKETKHGQSIRRNWLIRLRETSQRTVQRDRTGNRFTEIIMTNQVSKGPFGHVLADWSLAPRKPFDKGVLAELKAARGFAAYQLQGMYNRFAYWFVKPDGSETDDDAALDTPSDWPSTGAPYPISDSERKLLERHGHS